VSVATSQNGYSANDRSVIRTYVVPRTKREIALRKGSAGIVLCDWLAWFHETIEPLDTGILDDWGYAERTIRGSLVTVSNHASGTAADVNATQHPLRVPTLRTFTPDEVALIHARLALYEGVLRWGGDYTGRVDSMHVEIVKPARDVVRVARRILAGEIVGGWTVPKVDGLDGAWPFPSSHALGPNGGNRPTWHDGRVPGSRGRVAVKQVQRLVGVLADGVYGPATVAAVKRWQQAQHLPATGVIRKADWDHGRAVT
jgi:peptidoglycan hydrolase-like protein with peptidoglycan-binding domain